MVSSSIKGLSRQVKKVKDAKKRGASNRRNGRNAERKIVKWLETLGLSANLVPASGSFKSRNYLKFLPSGEQKDYLRGDIKLTINDKIYTIESKRNIHSDSWYKKTDYHVVHIKGFAFMLSQEDFEHLLTTGETKDIQSVEDKGFKIVHTYFKQDDSDMVIISRPYCPYLVFIKEEHFEQLKQGSRHTHSIQ